MDYGIGIFFLGIFQLLSLLTLARKYSIKSIPLILFLISFFTYFQSRDLISACFPSLFDEFGLNRDQSFNQEMTRYNSIFISLWTLGLGFWLSLNKFRTFRRYEIESLVESRLYILIKKKLLFIFYLTSIFVIIKIITLGGTIINGSYGRAIDSISVGQLTKSLSFLNQFSYIAFLCCMPNKKEIRRTLPLFILLSIGNMAEGTRGYTVCIILYLIYYFQGRDFYLDKSDVFLNKRIKLILFSSAPFILAGLSLFAFVRLGQDVQSKGMMMDSLSFFVQQGGTGHLITLSENLENSLPKGNFSYTFGPIINLLKSYMGIVPTNIDQDIYVATEGNNLGATLTYLTQPAYYFMGGGLGTSYLAELFIDFGYCGIVVYNFLLGIALRYLAFDVRKNLLTRVICSFILLSIFFLPRDFALSFCKIFTPTYIICLVGLLYLINIYKKYIASIV